MFKRFFSRYIAPGLAAAFFVAGVAQAQQEGYVAIDPPQPTATGDKIEVLEFFQYGCPHCRAMEPLIDRWEKTLGEDVALRRIPVAFNASMTPWQHLYYTLESLNRLDLQKAVFNAVQTERNPLNSRDRIVDWAEKQGLDKSQFGAMYDSFGVAAKVQQATRLINAYSLESVPTLVVDGRYMTSPALANGYGESLDMVSTLLERARAGR